jgi:hypothetical protein
MTKSKSYIAAAAVALALTGASSCKKDFGEINTDPSVVTTPDIGFLLTYAEDAVEKYQYTEWIWESMEQLFRFTQHITTDPYEMTSNVNLRYNTFYQQILPNLTEIRRQIGLKEDSVNYQKAAAVTYVLQVLHGIKVTDMNGSIPYTQAAGGRYDSKFDPTYDAQQQLFDTFLSQLDGAISVLSDANLASQVSYGSSDVYYKGDWSKWVKLANSLKLRIAARLELQDQAKASQVFQQVMQDATGPIQADDDQLVYQNEDYFPFGMGGEITYRSQRFGTTSIVDFMKKASDPRLPIYFDPNGLKPGFKDTLAKYGASLPSFIDPDDPLVMYQGGPADFTTNPTRAGYVKNAFPVGNTNAGNSVTNYFLISPVNTRFFSPRVNGAQNGFYKDVMVTAAESALLIAEFIQKGYAGSVDTKGTAADWYNKGIASSIRTMNSIAQVAQSATAFDNASDAEVNDYLNDANVMLNGSNDLERIYIQEYLNYYRNANEAFVFCRRTGYPKNGSAYYA